LGGRRVTSRHGYGGEGEGGICVSLNPNIPGPRNNTVTGSVLLHVHSRQNRRNLAGPLLPAPMGGGRPRPAIGRHGHDDPRQLYCAGRDEGQKGLGLAQRAAEKSRRAVT